MKSQKLDINVYFIVQNYKTLLMYIFQQRDIWMENRRTDFPTFLKLFSLEWKLYQSKSKSTI